MFVVNCWLNLKTFQLTVKPFTKFFKMFSTQKLRQNILQIAELAQPPTLKYSLYTLHPFPLLLTKVVYIALNHNGHHNLVYGGWRIQWRLGFGELCWRSFDSQLGGSNSD